MKRKDAVKGPVSQSARLSGARVPQARARTRGAAASGGASSTTDLGSVGVVGLVEDAGPGEVRVRLARGELLSCQVLRTSDALRLVLAPGQEVLVARLGEGRGCVLGRVEPYDPRPPSEVRLSATESLVMSCGETSVELSAQGKAAVRGVDVVSSARRRNRINGGSVEIN